MRTEFTDGLVLGLVIAGACFLVGFIGWLIGRYGE